MKYTRKYTENFNKICFTFLNSKQVKALPICPPKIYSSFNDDYPFLRYCSLYSEVHASQDFSDCARSLALQLLQEFDYHVSTYFLVIHMCSLELPYYRYTFRLSGMHCASFFGIVEIVAALMEIQGYDTSKEWYLGDSPLALAAQNGHEEGVKMLTGWAGVDPDEPNHSGMITLSYAAGYGRKGVVEILIGRVEVNRDRIDDLDQRRCSMQLGMGMRMWS